MPVFCLFCPQFKKFKDFLTQILYENEPFSGKINTMEFFKLPGEFSEIINSFRERAIMLSRMARNNRCVHVNTYNRIISEIVKSGL